MGAESSGSFKLPEESANVLDASTMAEGDINSPDRRVCTRLYFTSESHIQTLMNVLRYGHRASDASDLPADGFVCESVEKRMQKEPVFDYLTQIVFRLYMDKLAAEGSPERY